MELYKHKDHRSDQGVASWTYFEDLDVIRMVNTEQSEDSWANLTNER